MSDLESRFARAMKKGTKEDAKHKALKARITLKSGETIEAGKKYSEPRKKPLRSWGDETPRFK